MNFTVRKMFIPHDYTQVAKLLNYILSEETNAEALAEEDSKIPAAGHLQMSADGLLTGFDRYRIVAEGENGQILGYGISWRAPWTAAGELNHTLVVHPDYRNQGIGRSIFASLEGWAVSNGGSKLNFEVQDDEKDSVAFAKRNGFEVERHVFESVLDLSTFDPGLFELANKELDIVTLVEIADPDKEMKLYELYKETTADIPGFSGDFFDFHGWKNWSLKLPGSKPEYVFVALDETGEFIGVAHVLLQQASNSMYHEYTGVHKNCRGQGIGLALKLKCIELALSLNLAYMRTNNDSLNAPMLRINRDHLHFKAVPGKYKMVKQFSKEEYANAADHREIDV